MKAIQRTAGRSETCRHRMGGAFAYVMAYMTLSAMLLGLSGSVLHSILRTSDTDRRMFREIHVTEAAAEVLRDDGGRCVVAKLTDNGLVMELADSQGVAWTAEQHQLLREVVQSGQIQSRGQFRFQPGTELTFRKESERLYVLRITAPPVGYLPTASAKTDGVRKSIDVFLAVPVPELIP